MPPPQIPVGSRRGRHLALHSSIANVNRGQMLRLWRNATDGFVYVALPGGLLPGPFRVLRRGSRHVTDRYPVRVAAACSLCQQCHLLHADSLQRASFMNISLGHGHEETQG